MTTIGQWAARFREDMQLTRWHYIESVIADRLVVHCGRQMPRVNRKGELATDPSPQPTMKCERCAK